MDLDKTGYLKSNKDALIKKAAISVQNYFR